MGLETVQWIGDLVAANPPDVDPRSQGAAHLRNIKTALLDCFPGWAKMIVGYGVAGGSANAMTLTLVPDPGAPAAGEMLIVSAFGATNTAPTIQVNANPAKTITRDNGLALFSGDIREAGQALILVYNGTSYDLINPDNYGFVSTKTFFDSADATKQLQLALSGITTANTRQWTVQDKNITVAGIADIAPNQIGVGMARGSESVYNAGAPTTKWDLTAQQLQLRDPNTGLIVVINAPATQTVDITLAGPALLGRDQAGGFSVSTFVFFYWIAKADGTLSAIASASATGPTLTGLTGYTYWWLDSIALLDGSSLITKMWCDDDWMFFHSPTSLLSGGTATSPTLVPLLSFLPTNAIIAQIHGHAQVQDASSANPAVLFQLLTGGATYESMSMIINSDFSRPASESTWLTPCQANFYYTWNGAWGGRSVSLLCNAFKFLK